MKFLDGGGGGKGGKGGGGKYREVCWDPEKRGTLGETLVHVCLLQVEFCMSFFSQTIAEHIQGTSTHNVIARRALIQFPKLVNDIFISEEYYGRAKGNYWP